MLKKVKGVKVNYFFHDIGSKVTLVLLHGWNQNIEMMMPVGEKFFDRYNVLIIDLPGFGKSSEPDYSWTVYEYAECVKQMVDDLCLDKIILIGHSFGGRVGLIYASMYDVYKLICFASPYCKELKKLPLKTRIYKILKKIGPLKWLASIMKNYIGSTDYKNATEVMRGVLVQSINIEMVEDIKKIKAPTLLIWGSLDTAVPLKRAYELETLIENAGVVVYEGATHYAYLERLNEVVEVIDNFIGK